MMTVVPYLGKRLNDPNIVNKMSNSALMRSAARLAVRVKLKFEEAEEEEEKANRLKKKEDGTDGQKEDGTDGQKEDGTDGQKDPNGGGSKERISRVRSREYYDDATKRLRKRQK
jgi:hypothetical protein